MIIKKLLFSLPFLLSFLAFLLNFKPFLKNPTLLLELNSNVIFQSIYLVIFLLLANLFLAILITLAPNWKICLPVFGLGALSSFFILPPLWGFLLAPALLLAFSLNYYLLGKKLAGYLSFQPIPLLSPFIKQTTILILLVITIIFYLAVDIKIKEDGFTVPDSLIETSMKMIPKETSFNVFSQENQEPLNLADFNITPQQIEELKKNPEVLKQYGLDPALLDELTNPQANNESPSPNLIRTMVKSQLQSFIKPYQGYIPIILAALFFLSLSWISSLLMIIVNILLIVIFWALKIAGFTNYQTETREVQKLII